MSLIGVRRPTAVGSLPDVIANAPSGDATGATDTAALQAAINATPAGGYLLIPGHPTDKTKPYFINAPLTITKHIRIEGRSLAELWKPLSGGGGNQDLPSGLAGTVIQQVTAATDAIQIFSSALSVWLRNFGITFAAGIAGNTGHGINAMVTVVNGAGFDMGVMGSVWENISVYGHDGNHYAFAMRNPELMGLKHLRGYGGGALYLEGNPPINSNYGNLAIEDLYGMLINAGSADGIHLASFRGANLNLIDFYGRPQINIGQNAANTAQAFFNVSGAGIFLNIAVIRPDFEPATVTNPINFGGRGSGIVVTDATALGGVAPTGGFDASADYILFNAAGNYTVTYPAGKRKLRYRIGGAGGSGAGGGTNAAGAANAGGSGGGSGMVVEGEQDGTPGETLNVTVGAGHAGGAGGAAGGHAGTAGTNGDNTVIGGVASAHGGGAGQPGAASNNTTVGGGGWGSGVASSTANQPGFGGQSGSVSSGSIPVPPGIVGGGGGGSANATNGGTGGQASTTAGRAQQGAAAGATGGSANANGTNGADATTPGCGGGGGGGAPSGGAGGNGGHGADGFAEFWWD